MTTASLTLPSFADLVSHFDSSDEGWTKVNAKATLQWQSSGGNPGGYLWGKDYPDGIYWYYRSPTSWSGDWTLYDTLSFDLRIVDADGGRIRSHDLVHIVGTQGTLNWNGRDGTLGSSWTHKELALEPSTFGVSDSFFNSVISDVSALWISGDNTNAVDIAGLDNVVISAPEPELYGIFVGGESSRGNDDAEAIRAALGRFSAVESENLHPVVTTVADLESTISSVKTDIQPGDSLVFFYGGHGSFNNDDTEQSVAHSLSTRATILASIGEWHPSHSGDEILRIERENGITDDWLFTQLSDPEFADVKKLFLIDACFSGGFWGQPDNDLDVGDLDKLQNAGLIASASENGLSMAIPPLFGDYSLRGWFSIALENTLNALADADSSELTFSRLAELLPQRYARENFPDQGVILDSPWFGDHTVVEYDDDLATTAQFTADFDPNANLVVPEPSTLALLFVGAVGLLVHALRKRS
jgi:hypothetical protein